MLNYNHDSIKIKSVKGRWVAPSEVYPILETFSSVFSVECVGESVEGRAIKTITLGSGNTRILMWSQMHGNESTTTKSVLDVIRYLKEGSVLASDILKSCTLKIIPILNPDGAISYTRANANSIDLNRDAQERTQPESLTLWEVYEDFKPHFCFNLHDQRTIFNVGTTDKPATISFLAPAQDVNRNVTDNREAAMKLIVAMNTALQALIPGQVGRYDDSFNSNCVGDAFQMLGTPTILFEAGHYPKDYGREQTRYYIFIALMEAITTISRKMVDTYPLEPYFEIPENNKLYYDVIIDNIDQVNPIFDIGASAGILYMEKLIEDKIVFVPSLEKVGDLTQFYGHAYYNCLDPKGLDTILSEPNLLNLLK